MQSQRIEWLDVAKGIAILLMVAGHTTIPKPVSNFIWAFHMPLFFIASGWCTRLGGQFGEFLVKKTKTLLMPFAIYTAIVLPLNCLIDLTSFNEWLIKGWGGVALWFIPVLFLALILTKVIMTMSRKVYRSIALAVVLALGIALHKLNVGHNWTLSSIPYATCLIVLGSYAKKYTWVINIPRWWWVVTTFILTAAISHFWRLDMAWNIIQPVVPLTIGAVSGTFMVFCISSYICKYSRLLTKVLSSIGKETYLILAFSQIIIGLMLHYTSWSSPIRYSIMIIMLVALKYMKDLINKIIGQKIL